jgi:hypothetical protein
MDITDADLTDIDIPERGQTNFIPGDTSIGILENLYR